MAGSSPAIPALWGTPNDRFRPTAAYRIGAYISLGFLILAVASYVALGQWQASATQQWKLPPHERSEFLLFLEQNGTACCVIIPGMIGTFAFPYFLLNALRLRKAGIDVHEEGFVVKDGNQVFPWQDIVEIRGYHYESTTDPPSLPWYGYLIRSSDGTARQVELSELQRDEEFEQLLMERTLLHLLPPAQALLQVNGHYDHGYLKLDQHGFANGEKFFPWSAIRSVQSLWRNLVIQGQGRDGPIDERVVHRSELAPDGFTFPFHLGYRLWIHDLGNTHVVRALADSQLLKRMGSHGD